MTRSHSTTQRPDTLLEAARTLGHVSIRLGRMKPGQRWVVDPRDPACVIVYVAEDVSERDWPAIEHVLRDVVRRRRRRDLEPVAEIEGDGPLEDAVGSESVELPAQRHLGIVN